MDFSFAVPVTVDTSFRPLRGNTLKRHATVVRLQKRYFEACFEQFFVFPNFHLNVANVFATLCRTRTCVSHSIQLDLLKAQKESARKSP